MYIIVNMKLQHNMIQRIYHNTIQLSIILHYKYNFNMTQDSRKGIQCYTYSNTDSCIQDFNFNPNVGLVTDGNLLDDFQSMEFIHNISFTICTI